MIEALADVMVIKGVPEHIRSDNGPEFVARESAQVAGRYRGQDAVHRAGLSLGERLLRELQLEAAGRVPERRNLLLDERNPRAGRALARPLQHGQAALVAGLPPASAAGLADNEPGAWRSGNRYALPTSPHPRLTAIELRNSRATLTMKLVQKIGQATLWLDYF